MTLLEYIIKVSLALVVLYLPYHFLLKNLTFFRINRFYLLLTVFLALLLPFLKLPVHLQGTEIVDYGLGIDWEELRDLPAVTMQTEHVERARNPLLLVLLLYFSVSLFKFFFGFIQMTRLTARYRGGSVRHIHGIRIKIHDAISAPFTLFRTVYLDRNSYQEGKGAILRHEMVHARQLHSLDLLLAEIICAFLWFHPFVFLLKRHMKENHEFLADSEALNGNMGLVPYLQALSEELSRKHDPAYASSFRSSTIKKRIIMLSNKKTNNKKQWFYLLLLPVMAIITLAFQQPVDTALEEASMLQIQQRNNVQVPGALESDIPARFPLDDKHRASLTAGYNQEFKNPFTGKMTTHRGVDYKAPEGTLVYATGNGVVAKSEFADKYGKLIILKHAKGYISLYAHLDRLDVAVGEEVKMGQQIGAVGSTGYSTGPHLHYEVRKDGENVDPADYFK